MLVPERVSGPTLPLLSLDEIKRHCRVDHHDDDLVLMLLGEAATDHLDGWGGTLGRCLVTQVWRQTFPTWRQTFLLPFPDVQGVTFVYRGPAGTPHELSPSDFAVFEGASGSFVRLSSGFTRPALLPGPPDPVAIDMVVGYGAPDAVPAALRTAVLMLVAHWYEHREAVTADVSVTPMAVDALLAPYRRRLV